MNTGTLTADGTEQTVLETAVGTTKLLHGYISLTNMTSGDTVVLRTYIYLNASYQKFDEDTLSDIQDPPVAKIEPSVVDSGHDIKVTLQQTAGTYRSYAYGWVTKA